MTDKQLNSLSTQFDPEEEGIGVFDMLIVLARHKRLILILPVVTALIAAGLSLLMPNIYTSEAKILPPRSGQSSLAGMLMQSQLGSLAGAAGASLGLKDPNALYTSMLNSQRIMEKIVQRFDLQKTFGTDTMMQATRALRGVSKFTSGDDGTITISVDDKDPQRAAAMANAFVEELGRLMQSFALTEAAQRRQFFETQMKQEKDKLTDAEVAFDKTPNTSLHYMDALRNLKHQEAIYEVLAKQYEAAKLDEAKDTPLIQVLDSAVAPDMKSRPKRTLMVLGAAFAAFFLAVVWSYIVEAMARSREYPERAERIEELRRLVAGK